MRVEIKLSPTGEIESNILKVQIKVVDRCFHTSENNLLRMTDLKKKKKRMTDLIHVRLRNIRASGSNPFEKVAKLWPT